MTLPELARILNTAFNEPFLPKGFVRATLHDDDGSLRVQIGNRDIQITEDGKIAGSGTLLDGGWTIERIC